MKKLHPSSDFPFDFFRQCNEKGGNIARKLISLRLRVILLCAGNKVGMNYSLLSHVVSHHRHFFPPGGISCLSQGISCRTGGSEYKHPLITFSLRTYEFPSHVENISQIVYLFLFCRSHKPRIINLLQEVFWRMENDWDFEKSG